MLSDSFTKEAISGRDCVPNCPLKFYAFPRNKEYLTQPFVTPTTNILTHTIMGVCQVTFQIFLTVQSNAKQLNILTNRATALSVCSVLIPQNLVGSSQIDRLKYDMTWCYVYRMSRFTGCKYRVTSSNLSFPFGNFLSFHKRDMLFSFNRFCRVVVHWSFGMLVTSDAIVNGCS